MVALTTTGAGEAITTDVNSYVEDGEQLLRRTGSAWWDTGRSTPGTPR